ncbi:MAG: hypothetical protein Fur003_3120 [Candidatus Dojkabacteria bacterium]
MKGVSESVGASTESDIVRVALAADASKTAVINFSMMNLLGLKEKDVVGKTFKVVFVATSTLTSGVSGKLETFEDTYKIIGVISDDTKPFFYVPFTDLRGIGIENYSSMRIIADKAESLSHIRDEVEGRGFTTVSVADTKAQIDALFKNIQTILLIVGSFALAVASLGMFNTLTVSLLERTREVGLMKAMGMSSKEVKVMFLNESMLMGFYGGVLGIFFGFLAGKLLGFVLTLVTATSGEGFLDVSYIPLPFLIGTIVMSLLVGTFTGFFPARRATSISSLNALRYE